MADQVQTKTLRVQDVTSEAIINDQMHFWVSEMAEPLLPVKKLKGAIAAVSREMGISYSYARKCYYDWERAEPKTSRYMRAKAAYYRWMTTQREHHAQRVELIDKLKAEFGPPGENQIALDL